MIRVAVIEPVGGHSGMDYYDFGLCEGLVENGVGATLYTCDEVALRSEQNFPIKRYYEQIYGNSPVYIRGLRYIRGTLLSLIHAKKFHTNVIHFHVFHIGFLEFLNLVLCKLFRFRVVLSIHDIVPFAEGVSNQVFSKWSYRISDILMAHSRIGEQELKRLHQVDRKSVAYVPLGNYLYTASQLKSSDEARQILNIPLGKKVLLFFGQIKVVKGLDVLLEALAEVIKIRKDIVLVIAGKVWKDDFDKYQKIIDDNSLRKYCRLYIRYINDKELGTFFGAADLVVLPYRRIYQSAVLLTAIAYGRPVLVSDIGGMKEIIEHEYTGFLFTAEDKTDLAKQIAIILNDRSLMEQVVDNATELMVQKYSWKEIGRQTTVYYRQALSDNSTLNRKNLKP